jgi:hypothetical protein
VIKAKIKIHQNSMAMGHLMIKAIQLVKKHLLRLALAVRRRWSPHSNEEAYPWKMWLGVFVKGSLQGGNYITLALIMLLSLV